MAQEHEKMLAFKEENAQHAEALRVLKVEILKSQLPY